MSIPIYGISDSEFRNSITFTTRAIVPIGSLEQHGEHLPISTDSLIAESIAESVAKKVGSFVLPTIYYGVSYEHRPMFNVSVNHSTLSNMVRDLCCSLAESGIKSILLLNGHHGNIGALQYIGQDVFGKIPEDVRVFSLNYWQLIKNEFDHAGEVETSLLLAISPSLVKINRARPNSKQLTKSKVAYASITNNPGTLPKITGNGVWGDPSRASVQKGRKLLDEIIENLARIILYELE
jgi:creatinine amidohydrolase